jgi:uncharacterized membrane protein
LTKTSVLSALPFGQCIVCSSFWSVYCLLFLLVSVLSGTGQKKEQTIHWPKGRADNTLVKRKSRQYTEKSLWPVYCLLFLLVSVLCALPFGQCIVCSSLWSVYCVLFLLTKRKSRQYTYQKEEQTMHWPKGRADKVLAKRKSRQYTGQCIVCSSFRSVYCLLLLLASVLSALPFSQCIVCSSFWPVYLAKGRADNTLTKRKSRQCTGQKEEQTIH